MNFKERITRSMLLFFVAFLVIGSFVACDPIITPDPEYSVSGTVSETKGGPLLEGAKVTGPGNLTAETDAQGRFVLDIPYGYTTSDLFDITIVKDGYGTASIQDFSVDMGDMVDLEIPMREAFNQNWSMVSPEIAISGVTPHDVVEGDLTFDVVITGDRPIYVFYVYFAGIQRAPRDGFFMDTGEGEVVVDTTLYPNGKTFILVQANDDNGNFAAKYIPVDVNNVDVATTPPEDLFFLGAYSITLGDTLGFYVDQREEIYREYNLEGDPFLRDLPFDHTFNLRSLPEGISLFTEVFWVPVEEATAYRVYRSFDGENFDLISITPEDFIQDMSPKLRPEKEVFYRVVPFNSFGDGGALERSLIPLCRLNISLKDPANGATGVSTTPTFTWEKHESMFKGTQYEDLREDIYFDYFFWIFDTTSWLIHDWWIEEDLFYEYPLMLEPGAVYSWDIFDAEAFIIYDDMVDGYSFGLSLAGHLNNPGSFNGENIFTTEYVAEEGSE